MCPWRKKGCSGGPQPGRRRDDRKRYHAGMKGFEPEHSFDEDVARTYDDVSLRGDEDAAVEFLAGLAGKRRTLELAIGMGRIALALGGFGPIWDGLYVAVFAALVFCVARSVSLVSQFLACRPMVWLGTVSYSLYLIHALVIVAVAKGATALGLNPSSLGSALVLLGIFLVLSLVAEDVLQRCVEQPARVFLRRRWLHAKS